MKIIVPATSANLGAGFDSMGVAVNLYLTVEVLGQAETWQVDHDLGKTIPTDEQNLLLTTLSAVLKAKNRVCDICYHVKMTSEIPLARGLGSSSSVIVAGIELAHQLFDLQLTNEEKLAFATKIEGHPDNVAPALLGKLIISESATEPLQTLQVDFPQCHFLAFVPDYELKTTDSRKVLPQHLEYKAAVHASAISNMLVASLLTGNLKLAGKMMEQDLFHEPYRSSLIPELAVLKAIGHENGAFGTYLSGAGPTVMLLCADENLSLLTEKIQSESKLKGRLYSLEVETKGVRIEQ